METKRLIIDAVKESDKQDYFDNIRFIEYLFDEKGFRTVCASFFTGNDASRRVMEKCGMTFDRISEKEINYLGKDRDLTYYSVSRG